MLVEGMVREGMAQEEMEHRDLGVPLILVKEMVGQEAQGLLMALLKVLPLATATATATASATATAQGVLCAHHPYHRHLRSPRALKEIALEALEKRGRVVTDQGKIVETKVLEGLAEKMVVLGVIIPRQMVEWALRSAHLVLHTGHRH